MYAQVSGTHWTSNDHCDLPRCSETTQAHFCHSRLCLNRETGFGGAHQSLSLLQGGEAEGNVPRCFIPDRLGELWWRRNQIPPSFGVISCDHSTESTAGCSRCATVTKVSISIRGVRKVRGSVLEPKSHPHGIQAKYSQIFR